MKWVEIRMPEELAKHFLRIAEWCDDRMGAAGCNDFPIDDTPDNRLLLEMCEARNLNMTVEEYRKSRDYFSPNVHAGKLYGTDFAVFSLFKSYIESGLSASC